MHKYCTSNPCVSELEKTFSLHWTPVTSFTHWNTQINHDQHLGKWRLLFSAVYKVEKTILQYLHWSCQLNVSVPTLKYSTPVYEVTIYGPQSTFTLQVGKWLRLETLPTWNVFLTREWNDKGVHCTPLSGTSPWSGRCEDRGSQVCLSRLPSTWLGQPRPYPQWHHKVLETLPCQTGDKVKCLYSF